MVGLTREFRPDEFPPFPEDAPIIALQTISLAKLEAGDESESERLFDLCTDRGFFYLDFTGTSAAALPEEMKSLVEVAEDTFKLPKAEKMKSKPNGTTNLMFGYKGPGIGLVDTKGTKATNEFFTISKDDMIAPESVLYWPQPIMDNKSRLASDIQTLHETGMTCLSVLAKQLHLPADAFANIHRFSAEAGDNLRFTRGPPRQNLTAAEIQTASHCDFGTLTILFNWLGGLQLWSEPERKDEASRFAMLVDPDQGEWLWVKPPAPGHALVNLGDSAAKLTNGVLASGRHRVVPAPGEQGAWPRYSVVYFVRPEDNAIIRSFQSDVIPPVQGEVDEITTFEWTRRQLTTFFGKKSFGLAPPGFAAKEAAKAPV